MSWQLSVLRSGELLAFECTNVWVWLAVMINGDAPGFVSIILEYKAMVRIMVLLLIYDVSPRSDVLPSTTPTIEQSIRLRFGNPSLQNYQRTATCRCLHGRQKHVWVGPTSGVYVSLIAVPWPLLKSSRWNHMEDYWFPDLGAFSWYCFLFRLALILIV